MASIALRLKPKPCSLRLFSSSSSATPPPPSSNDAEDPSASFPSYLSDIKARLRESPSPTPRRIPINPPKPDIFSPQGSDKVASLDEIRKNLAEFRRRSAPPSSPNSSRPTSLLDAYKTRPDKPGGEGGEDGRSDRISLSAIRESLQQLKATAPQQVPGAPGRSRPSAGSISLRSLKDSLKITPGRLDALPKSIFGKELEKHEDGGTEPKVRNKEFLKQYSHEELGEKLRMLRPKAENGGEQRAPFSLHELNERLARLRELEEKETASRMGGVHFMDLKESLMKLRDSDAKKKTSMHRLSIIGHIAGQTSPNYMRGPPKEELVEKYFHPDLMSSAEKMKLELKRVRDEFKMSESDCGSARVQVAQLTTKIKHLSSVLHKKDKHSQKGLQAMVQTRKKLLKYLRRTDWDSYSFVLSKLGLRDAPDYRT